jgi:hypothetical protein
VLIAVNSRFRSFKQRFDLPFYEGCVWVELPAFDGENLLIGNHYFPPDTSPNKILNYFSFLENKLGTKNYRVILMGILILLGLIGNAGCPYQTVIFIPSLMEGYVYRYRSSRTNIEH